MVTFLVLFFHLVVGILDPETIPKYENTLRILGAMPKTVSQDLDYYEIALRQFQQALLPPSMKMNTTVWGYGSPKYPQPCDEGGSFCSPSLTIEAQQGRPVRVKWINQLVDQEGRFLPHLFPVDQTVHWSNPAGPQVDSSGSSFDLYQGPVPIITHVHGAHTTDDSDGYPEAWFLPDAVNIDDYVPHGSKYAYFQNRSVAGKLWTKGSSVFEYPNIQRAATLWYHDHTLGLTRLNVYAGAAGLFVIRNDSLVHGTLPGPYPRAGDAPGTEYFEMPLLLQDRTFNDDGSLFYPDSRAYSENLEDEQLEIPFQGQAACNNETSDVHPRWNPEFYGNTILVNGKVWPRLAVKPQRYRFRVVNACNARFFILSLALTPRPGDSSSKHSSKHSTLPGHSLRHYLHKKEKQAGKKAAHAPFHKRHAELQDLELEASVPSMWVIGNDGGFLPQPFETRSILFAPGERLDLELDFTHFAGHSLYLLNLGPDSPYDGAAFQAADPDTTGQIMRFDVQTGGGSDPSTPPAQLGLPPTKPYDLAGAYPRMLSLTEYESMSVQISYGADNSIVLDCSSGVPFGPVYSNLGTFQGNPEEGGSPTPYMWSDNITETPTRGRVEIWEFFDLTEDAHPIHIHQVQFQVINRIPFGDPQNARPPEPWELGFKDTLIVYPDEVTRVALKFDIPGLFVWHCHLLEHEDVEMMRPIQVT